MKKNIQVTQDGIRFIEEMAKHALPELIKHECQVERDITDSYNRAMAEQGHDDKDIARLQDCGADSAAYWKGVTEAAYSIGWAMWHARQKYTVEEGGGNE